MPDVMSFLTSGGVYVISFLLVLGLLVFVHELGHFAVAKWAGIKVEEFGFGFPPRMVTLFKRGETVYTLNWLPLGGFVRMIGENGEEADNPRSFAAQSPFWRGAVLVAGSTMNLLLPIFLFAILAMAIGVPEGEPTGRIEVIGVEPNSPAAEAGLRPGDEIVYVGSQRVLNTGQLQALVQNFEGREVTIDVLRNGEQLDFSMTPRHLNNEPQVKVGVAIVDQREHVRYNPIDAFAFGLDRTRTLFVMMLQGFGELIANLFQGTSENVPVAGPLGIMQATGEVAQTGRMEYMLHFIALLSVNLAIINMMPIPALDGGRLLFVVIEALRGGKRISPEREGMVHFVGMLLLLGLIAFISVIDLKRLLGGVSVLQ